MQVNVKLQAENSSSTGQERGHQQPLQEAVEVHMKRQCKGVCKHLLALIHHLYAHCRR